MGSFNVAVPGSGDPTDVLSRLPPAFRAQAEKGFEVLADVDKQHYGDLLRAVVVTVEGNKPPLEDLENSLKLAKGDVNSLFAAAMLTVPPLAQGISQEQFLASIVKAGIVPQSLVPKIQPFVATVIAESAQIARKMRRASLPNQVLPYLSNIEVVVDLRIAFEKEAVSEVVPVAIVHIDTDAYGEEIWFQASIELMRQLRSDVDEAIKRMEAAEAWSNRRSRES